MILQSLFSTIVITTELSNFLSSNVKSHNFLSTNKWTIINHTAKMRFGGGTT